MPTFCVAFGCTSTPGRDEVAFHKFPQDRDIAAKWVAAIQREDFEPTNASVVCSKHFRDSDYTRSPSLTKSLGVPVKRARLNRGAVPSVFSYNTRVSPPPRPAYAKRRRREIIAKLLAATYEATETGGSPSGNGLPGDPAARTAVDDTAPTPADRVQEILQGGNIPKVLTCSRSVQVLVRPPVRTSSAQVDVKKRTPSRSTQTKPGTVSVGTNTTLLPSLALFLDTG